jgi:hypothetical protein
MTTWIAVVLLLAVLLQQAQVARAQGPAMPLLTMPAAALPAGCELKPDVRAQPSSAPDSIVVGGTSSVPTVPSNPWIGTDRRTLAEIRQRMGDFPIHPDAAPTRHAAARFFLSLADGVEEGYVAEYVDSQMRGIVVHALRLAPAELALSRRKNAVDAGMATAVRVEIGSIVAMIYGLDGTCTRAIESHLRALGDRVAR